MDKELALADVEKQNILVSSKNKNNLNKIRKLIDWIGKIQ